MVICFLARVVQYGNNNKPLLAVVTLSADKELLSVSPFISETDHTTYYDGLLLITSPLLDVSAIDAFVNRSTCINELIESLQYCRCQISYGERCRIYHISNIDWADFRFTPDSVVSVVV